MDPWVQRRRNVRGMSLQLFSSVPLVLSTVPTLRVLLYTFFVVTFLPHSFTPNSCLAPALLLPYSCLTPASLPLAPLREFSD